MATEDTIPLEASPLTWVGHLRAKAVKNAWMLVLAALMLWLGASGITNNVQQTTLELRRGPDHADVLVHVTGPFGDSMTTYPAAKVSGFGMSRGRHYRWFYLYVGGVSQEVAQRSTWQIYTPGSVAAFDHARGRQDLA